MIAKHRWTRLLAVLAAGALVLSACTGGRPERDGAETKSRAALYKNPVFEPKGSIPAEASDPMALKYNGEYYAYVTGGSCGVLHSKDLVTWEYLGPVTGDTASCWAPDVVYKNGTFYMYVSTTKWGQTEQDRRVRLYTAAEPQGPFTYQTDVTDHYSYDGHYFRASNGQEYLFWTRECLMSGMSPCSGNPNLVDTLTDMVKLGGRPARVGTPFGWECAGRCIFEAPQVLERDGRFYQIYSGGAYENETYGSGYATNTVVKGADGLNDYSWIKQNQILKSVSGEVSGPGGASWVKAPNNLEDWVIYHGRNRNNKGGPGRWLRIDPVAWGASRFWLPGAPSYTPQPGPGLPRFRDLFDRADQSGLGAGWQAVEGRWEISRGQANAAGQARTFLPEAASEYLLEANLRFEAGSSGLAGVYAYYADQENWLQALVRPADQALILRARVGGKEQPEAVHRLPGQPRAEFYHQLLVRKNADRFAIAFDQMPVASLSLAFGSPGATGLVVHDAAAAFDGIALAHGWEEFFTGSGGRGLTGWGAAGDGTKPAGQWQLKDGALEQGSAKGRSQIFKGSRDWAAYQATVSLQPLDPNAKGRYGLLAGYWDSRNYVEVLLDPATGDAVIGAAIGGERAKEERVPLGRLFEKGPDFAQPLALRVVKNGFAFRFELDGMLLLERSFALPSGQPGLVTVEGAARFDSILVVRLD